VGRDEVVRNGGKAGYGGKQSVAAPKLMLVAPKTKWSAAVIKLAMAEMKSSHNESCQPWRDETGHGENKVGQTGKVVLT
jgi:hypothetical protein